MSQLPQRYPGVMVSGTFKDLEKHRAVIAEALRKQELVAIYMEDYVVDAEDDEISSSLNMVRKASGYIVLISHRYGQIINCEQRNPNTLSVTHLEFEEAQRLELPTLVFVMSDEHEVKKRDIETDPIKIAKLNDFRTAAKRGRIYINFDNLEDFTAKVIHAIPKLRKLIEKTNAETLPDHTSAVSGMSIDVPDWFLRFLHKDHHVSFKRNAAVKAQCRGLGQPASRLHTLFIESKSQASGVVKIQVIKLEETAAGVAYVENLNAASSGDASIPCMIYNCDREGNVLSSSSAALANDIPIVPGG